MELTNSTAIPNASLMSALVTMFYEPTKTFQQLESRPRSWFPTLVLIVCMLAVMGWYFSMVDFPWLADQMASAMKTAEERDMFAKTMSKTLLQVSTLVSLLFIYPLMFAITGVYLMIASKMISHGITFGKGFALAAWASIPGILLLPLGAMQIMLNPAGQFGFSELNPVSLNQLVFHYDMAHPLVSLMDSLSLFTFWSMFLTVIGFEVWAKVKRSTAIKVVVLPYVIIFAGWYAIITAMGA